MRYQQDRTVDFLDGTIYGKNHFVLVVGKYKKRPDGPLDNFVNDKIYWKAIQSEKGTLVPYGRLYLQMGHGYVLHL